MFPSMYFPNTNTISDPRSITMKERAVRPEQRRATNTERAQLPQSKLQTLWNNYETFISKVPEKHFSAQASTSAEADYIKAFLKKLDPGLTLTLKRLIEVCSDEDEEVAPQAFEQSLKLLLGTTLSMRVPFPKATVSSNDSGGVFVFWRSGVRKIHLFVPATDEKRAYIYHEDGDQYAVDYDVTGDSLACWLNWYANA